MGPHLLHHQAATVMTKAGWKTGEKIKTLTLWPLMPGRPGVPGNPRAPYDVKMSGILFTNLNTNLNKYI